MFSANSSYREKYIKYKKKYMNLKNNNLSGGLNGSLSGGMNYYPCTDENFAKHCGKNDQCPEGQSWLSGDHLEPMPMCGKATIFEPFMIESIKTFMNEVLPFYFENSNYYFLNSYIFSYI